MKQPRTNTTSKISMMQRLLVPMVLVILLETGILTGVMLFGGPFQRMVDNAYSALDKQVASRQRDLGNDMNQRWTSLESLLSYVNTTTKENLAQADLGYGDLTVDSPVTDAILTELAPSLISSMRKNGVTGVFVLFESGQANKPGLYFRDADPTATPADNSDILVERAPTGVVNHLELALDSWWNPTFDFTTLTAESQEFFNAPMEAVRQNPGVRPGNLCYWSPPFRLSSSTDREVITYSVPLLNEQGQPYGVAGVEISTNYLRTLLPYEELGLERNASYLLAMSQDGGKTYQSAVGSGFLYSYQFGEGRALTIGGEARGSVYWVSNETTTGSKVVASVHPITLYNSNTPFVGQQWALIGLADEENLMAFPTQVRRIMSITLGVSVLIGLVISALMGRQVTRPISRLAKNLRTNTALPLSIDKINVREIDELTSAIEEMSHQVVESSTRLSRIIQISGISVAAFEHRKATKEIYFTDGFAQLLGIRERELDIFKTGECSPEDWSQLPLQAEISSTADKTWVYRTPDSRWVRVKISDSEDSQLGVVMDVTQEMQEMRRLEHDRDHDGLTGLLNRRAFQNMVTKLLGQPQRLGTAALVMLDLDNLKYINDTYGHDYGDQYIKLTATALTRGTPVGTVVARMAGDEFFAFFYGYKGIEQVRELIGQFHTAVSNTVLELPDDPDFRIRASMGVAWVPQDSDQYDDLLRFADFAMYTSKHTCKGSVCEFDRLLYEQEHYMLEGREALNKLIEQALVDIDFQPIVDCRTGKVFAYEALMRSRTDMFRNPGEILALARSESKLYQIERLTMFQALKSFAAQNPAPGTLLFINSIPNQLLGAEDVALLEQQYPQLLSQLVLELTREEGLDIPKYHEGKLKTIRSWQAKVALDDYGASINGDATLVDIGPDFIKIDMSIIRNVDTDANRLQIMRNFIEYAHDHGIAVVAQGVETLAELQTLRENGMDYVQGHLLGRPSGRLEQAAAGIVECLKPTE